MVIHEGTDSSSNLWEGGHLVRWRVLGNVVLLFLHPFAHRRPYRPMAIAIQELLDLLLLDVCLFLGICCMAAIRPAQRCAVNLAS